MRMARHLDFGVVWINFHIPLVARCRRAVSGTPGHGKDLSIYGFEDYTRIKHIMSFIGFLMSAPPRRMGSDRSQ
jgi:betaine-aldehyde dehydrogenase